VKSDKWFIPLYVMGPPGWFAESVNHSVKKKAGFAYSVRHDTKKYPTLLVQSHLAHANRVRVVALFPWES